MSDPVYQFEELIKKTDRVLPDAVFIVSDTGHAVWFDRREPDCKSEVRAFLKKQATARVIMVPDIDHWCLWLMDDGKDTVTSTRPKQVRDAPVFCDWKGLDFAGH